MHGIQAMAFLNEVGKINGPRGNVLVDWEIPNYFSLSQKADIYFKSPPFHLWNTEWCIRIYPNGTRADNSVGWIGLHLSVLCPFSTYSVTFKLGIKNLKTKIGNESGTRTFSSHLTSSGWNKVSLRTDILRLIKEESPDGTLVIYCEASAITLSVTDAASQISLDNTSVLCRDFADLLQSGRNSDMTIDVQGHIFKVHRVILETRSPVFAAMFAHDMKEKSDKIVKISDCDPDLFKDFLHYLYTGKVENLSWKYVIKLFEVSDKYSMMKLKKDCAAFMAEDLSAENVCDVLVVADRHAEKDLKTSVEGFVIKNIKTVKTTDKWRSLMAEHPSLALEILLKCIPDE